MSAVKLCLMLDLPNEAEVMKQIIENLEKSSISSNSRMTDKLAYTILKNRYPEENWAEIYSSKFKNMSVSEDYIEFGGINMSNVSSLKFIVFPN